MAELTRKQEQTLSEENNSEDEITLDDDVVCEKTNDDCDNDVDKNFVNTCDDDDSFDGRSEYSDSDYDADIDEEEEEINNETCALFLKQIWDAQRVNIQKRKQDRFLPLTKKFVNGCFVKREKMLNDNPQIIKHLVFLCCNIANSKIPTDISGVDKAQALRNIEAVQNIYADCDGGRCETPNADRHGEIQHDDENPGKTSVVETDKGVKFGNKTLPIAFDDMLADLTKNVEKKNTNLTAGQHAKLLLKELKKPGNIRSDNLRNQYRELDSGSGTPTMSQVTTVQPASPPPPYITPPQGIPLSFLKSKKGKPHSFMFDT
ncbi:Hypothetical predicted protein [Paramuricea clavata]|uniref:Uncharacterized protein n=1 Tax=Paramuricea clavata TaxID=317549 RepID=A0A6S7G458_PARCT|nr:Hypothetical predicted protein [Paramuricea clavata]